MQANFTILRKKLGQFKQIEHIFFRAYINTDKSCWILLRVEVSTAS